MNWIQIKDIKHLTSFPVPGTYAIKKDGLYYEVKGHEPFGMPEVLRMIKEGILYSTRSKG